MVPFLRRLRETATRLTGAADGRRARRERDEPRRCRVPPQVARTGREQGREPPRRVRGLRTGARR